MIGHFWRTLLAVLGSSILAINPVQADETASVSAAVPQVLLPLLHARQVQSELGLDEPEQQRELLALFGKIDGDWWRARLLPAAQQREVIAAQEIVVRNWLAARLSQDRQRRLEQMELRAQGIRILLRPDIVRRIGLTRAQGQQLQAAAAATDAALRSAEESALKGQDAQSAKAALQQAQELERRLPRTLLTREQSQALASLLGGDFDAKQLQRIYPMAPELEPVEHWINSQPLTLALLRGKVVVLHFYAFQCINCRRNLPHYNKWADEFKDRDVVVLGVQTPETAAERSPNAVQQAAQQEGISYPVLVDLQSKNWKAWGNTMWPTVYVIDRQGYIRLWWQGELNWQGATGDQKIRDAVLQLLAED